MQIILFGGVLMMASLSICQVWNNPSNGVTVKTLYVPLRKGSNAIPIPDFSQVRPLATLNIPNFSAVGDLPSASTLNQNIRPKVNMYQANIQPLQDVRVKINQQPFKIELQNQIHQIPAFNTFHQNTNVQQQHQQHNHVPYQQSSNHHSQGQNNVYTSHPVSNYVNTHPQNVVFQKSTSVMQHQNNGYANGNMNVQDSPMNAAVGRIVQLHNPVNHGHQAYTSDSVVAPRQPASNSVHIQYHNVPNTLNSFQPENNPNQESLPSQDTQTKYSSESSRYFQQIPSDTTTTQQSYMSSPTESPSYSPNHQMSYAVQSGHSAQHTNPSIRNANSFQGFHNQDSRNEIQQQSNHPSQPVNTYAIVHQRIPTNSFGMQGNRAAVQSEQGHYGHTPDENAASSHATYKGNEPSDYIKTAPNQEPFQVASQDHLKIENPQNSLESSQYQGKPLLSFNINGQQYSGHPVLSHAQLMMSQFRPNQQDSSDFNQQQSPSDISSQDGKSSQSQNPAPQSQYPDPSSETYYPDNKQVYVSPPPDYSSQSNHQHHQQQQLPMEQGYMRYSSTPESNGQSSQIPINVQNGQMSSSNRNYAYPDSTQYNNVYVQ